MTSVIFSIKSGANQIDLALPADMEQSYLRLRAYCEAHDVATPEPEIHIDQLEARADELKRLRRLVRDDASISDAEREAIMFWIRRHSTLYSDCEQNDFERPGPRLLRWGAKVI